MMNTNYKVAYEISSAGLEMGISSILPIMFIIIGFIVGIYNLKFTSKDYPKRTKNMIFGFAFGCFGFFFLMIGSPMTRSHFHKTNELYKNNKFKTIEGKIENFDPMPKAGHKHESFTINGVYFEYSDYYLAYHGFNNTASHGGPITHNGQELRLGYVTHTYHGRTKDFETNIIVKIELKK